MKKYLFIPTLLLTLSITIGCNNRKVSNIDIPRSHSGITLGAPYDSVKTVLKEHGFNIKKGPHSVGDLSQKPDIHETVDETYPNIKHLGMTRILERLIDDKYKKVSQEIRDKYDFFDLVFYNDTLVSIYFTPRKLKEVVSRLKNIYPFEERQVIADIALPKATFSEYSYENDQTMIVVGDHFVPAHGYIIYYDKRRYDEMLNYINSIDAEISNAHEREIDRIASGF